MTEERDTKKDLLVGAAALIAAAVIAPPAIAAAAGTLVAVGWNRVAASSQRRAEKLVRQMIDGDAEPEHFAEQLQQRLEGEDEESLAAFRLLLFGAVQAVSPDAFGPMAYVGRSYFRGTCALSFARASLEFLNQASATDLINLRLLMTELARLDGDVVTVMADASGRSDGKKAWRAWPDGKAGGSEAIDVTPFAESRYLFGLLKRTGLGSDSGGYGIGGSPKAIEFEKTAITLLKETLACVAAD